MATAHDIFWLARRAHNILTPICQAAREHEVADLRFKIEMHFDETPALSIWVFDGTEIPAYEIYGRTEVSIDRLVRKIADSFPALSAKGN